MIIELYKIDWAAIAAIASSVMVFYTWRTLRQNKRQLEELKRQWHEQNRAELSFSTTSDNGIFYIVVKNNGNRTAKDISIDFCGSFFERLLSSDYSGVSLIKNKTISIPSIYTNQQKYIPINIITTFQSERLDDYDMILRGKYNNRYIIDESISDKYNDILFHKNEIPNNLEHIKKSIDTLSETLVKTSPTKAIEALTDKGLKLRK